MQLFCNYDERKVALLRLLGEVHRQHEEQLFTKNNFVNFDKMFLQSRKNHSKRKTLGDFNPLSVDLLQLKYYPSLSGRRGAEPPPILPRMAPIPRVKRDNKKITKHIEAEPKKSVKMIETENLQRRVRRLKKSVQTSRKTLQSLRTEQIQLNSLKNNNLKLVNKISTLKEKNTGLNNRILELESSLTIAQDELDTVKKEQPHTKQCFLKHREYIAVILKH
uniref:Uncharacterized protein n=1 Tax=Panagrolaimus davidi TaxID=227884 RepID=A0A914QMM6_9BILA